MPTPTRVGRGRCSYLRFDGLLTRKQVLCLQQFVASADVQRSTYVQQSTSDGSSTRDRDSRIALLGRPGGQPPPEIPAWLDGRMRAACREAHSVYGDDVCPLGIDSRGRWTPRFEPVQYSEYAAGGHYAAWHTDAHPSDEHDEADLRCVTCVLMVSDEAAYSGGRLEVRLGGGRKASQVALRAGDAVVFPAKHLRHRVAKCKSGLRQTLVYWARRPGGVRC